MSSDRHCVLFYLFFLLGLCVSVAVGASVSATRPVIMILKVILSASLALMSKREACF